MAAQATIITALSSQTTINTQKNNPFSISFSPFNSVDLNRNQRYSFTPISLKTFSFPHSPTTPNASSFDFDLSPPPIDHDLLDTMEELGAKISEDGTVETFDNDDEAFNAATIDGVAVADLTHFGRIRVTGEDRVQFLHNQSTANFEALSEGQGCDTVFVTPTARTIDIAHSWVMKNAITLVVSPVTCRSIIEMLTNGNSRHYEANMLFHTHWTQEQPIVNVKGDGGSKSRRSHWATIWNTSTLYCKLHFFPINHQIFSTKVDVKKKQLHLSHAKKTIVVSNVPLQVNGMPITVGVGNLISEEGFSLLTSPAAAESVWKTLLSLGVIPMGAGAWERLRIYQGRPAPEKDLTNEFNVLEAGLWNAVSLNKGCYKGQETISRLITYDGVKQRLRGLHLSAPAEPGSLITLDGKKVGKLTSYTTGGKESKHFGLGYIKRQTASTGDQVNVGEVVGTVVDVPFLSREAPLPNAKSS